MRSSFPKKITKPELRKRGVAVKLDLLPLTRTLNAVAVIELVCQASSVISSPNTDAKCLSESLSAKQSYEYN